MNVKAETTWYNLFAICFIQFLITTKYGFLQAQLTFLLESEDHFAIEESVIGFKNSRLYVCSSVVALISLPVIGYIYELLGRRCVIITCLFSSCALLVIVPYTSPNFHFLVAIRSILGMLEGFATTNPLIADYVKRDSRGKGVSIRVLGALLGEICSMTLFGLTASMGIDSSFTVVAAVCACLTLIMPLIVREPKIKLVSPRQAEEDDDDAPLSQWEKIKLLTTQAKELIMTDNRYILCFIGSALSSQLVSVLFSIYYMLWISSFVRDPDGWLETDLDAKNVYKDTMIVSVMIALAIIPLAGKFADSIPAFVFIPFACGLRCILALQFHSFDDPSSTKCRAVSAFFVIASLLIDLGVESTLQRNLPKTIRALTLSINEFCGIAGAATFAMAAGYAFDTIGPAAPFTLVAILDIVYMIIVIMFAFCGMFRN